MAVALRAFKGPCINGLQKFVCSHYLAAMASLWLGFPACRAPFAPPEERAVFTLQPHAYGQSSAFDGKVPEARSARSVRQSVVPKLVVVWVAETQLQSRNMDGPVSCS